MSQETENISILREAVFKTQMQEYTVIAHPEGCHFPRITEAVRTVNGLQNHFRCKLVGRGDILSSSSIGIDAEALAASIDKQYGTNPVIALTEEYYNSGYIVEEQLPKHVLVTCADWDDGDQPPLRLFLIYSLASALITLEAGLSKKQNEKMGHKPPLGCIFDWWDNSQILRLDFVCARLCPECRNKLKEHLEDPDKSFLATQNMLDFVRRVMLGEKTSLPTKVWIVHGKSLDWKILKKLVQELGVEVDEFNEIVVAGIPISERWKQMAAEARFAFALLTRDDQDVNGNWLPRLNVAHEIGLCHARLGIESTAILREEDITVFSNLQGINYLSYEPGKLEERKAAIRAILQERGVL